MSKFRRRLLAQEYMIYIPYQQIEYLESTGTQYIDTEISVQNNFKCEIKVAKNISQLTASSYPAILAADSGSNMSICLGLLSNGQYYSQLGISGQFVKIEIDDINTHDFKINYKDQITNVIVDNGANYTYATTRVSNTNLTLFARRMSIGIRQYFCGKIKKCKMYINGIAVRNFVPVRVGNVGYMYDIVSGRLFGNSGIGDFILGPDI